ncbi:MAG: DUF4347 domain-containing protein [Oscillatoriophycideae cyanobacterium NC_groundwater_1537_Pr4_S-0.65um_50_18]|nr:DUF4347 domain-containing protein [Oscillatoriophycideae cyanobacterium NC_groundwater_1537_Pr4_S-0.65um_50_18]
MSRTTSDTIPTSCSYNPSQPIRLSPHNSFNTSQTVLVVIDSGVDQWADLASGIVEGAGVAVLADDQDGITQITALLKACPSVTSLHIVSHGEPSTLYLGNTQLSLKTIDRYAWDLQSWSVSSLLIYGCNVAAGKAGAELIEKLHRFTGAGIAASTSLTGNTELGGNWRLEMNLGKVDTALAFRAEIMAAYPAVLATVQFDVSSVLTDDIIVNQAGGVTDTTQTAIDLEDSALITQSFATSIGGAAGNGLPDDGLFAANAFHPEIQLAYRNSDDGINSRLIQTSTGSFTFAVTPGNYSEIHLATTSTEGSSAVQATFTYADGTTSTTTTQTVPDWYNSITESASSYYLVDGMDRSYADATTFQNVSNPAVFGLRFTPDSAKTLQSITIEKTASTGWLLFFGATGVTAANETPAGPLELRVDLADAGTNPTGNWNTIPGSGTFNALKDFNSGAATGVNLTIENVYTEVGSNQWFAGNVGWIDNNAGSDNFFGYKTAPLTARFSGLTAGKQYKIEVVSATNAGGVSSDVQVQGSFASRSSDGQGGTGDDWNGNIGLQRWLIWDTVTANASGEILVTSSAGAGSDLSVLNDIRIVEVAPNTPPTITAAQSFSLAENSAANTVVGTVAATDAEGNTLQGWQITAGNTDVDGDTQAAFAINATTGQITVNDADDLNFEGTSVFNLQTTVSDGTVTSAAQTVTVKLTDVVEQSTEAPTNILLSNSAVDENVAANSVIGSFSSVDSTANDTFTYSLIAGTGSTDNGAFLIVGDQLQINSSPDFEAKPNLSIRVRTTDQGGLTFDKILAIAINDVNEAPTDLSLSSLQVAENVPANTIIGTFATIDPDTVDTFAYSLVAGTGDTDNAAFTITNNQLKINTSPDFETKASYNIRVQTTDQNGLLLTKSLTVTVQDMTEPFGQFMATQTADGLQVTLSKLQEIFNSHLLQANLPIVGKMTGAIPSFLTTLRDQIVPAIRGAGNLTADAMETLLKGTLPGAQVVKTSTLNETSFEVTINQQSQVTKVASDLALPGLGLRVDNAKGQGTLNSQLKLVFGSNKDHGFFVDSGSTQLNSKLDFGLGANFSASGKMGLFKVKLADESGSPTRADAKFSAKLNDIDAVGAANDGNHLTTAELQTNTNNKALTTATLTSDPNLGLKITTDMGAAAIPGVNARLFGDIPLLNYSNGAMVGTPATKFTFKNTELSLGSIANNVVLPALKKVDTIIAPMRPVLDVLYSDLKSIGIGYLFPDIDKDGKVTLIDMASAIKPVGLGFIKNIKTLSDLSKQASASSSAGLAMGDYTATSFNPFGAANSLQSAGLTKVTAAATADQQLNSNGDSGASLIKSFKRMEGLKFNLFDDSSNAVRLLIGQPVTLFTYDLPELELSFSVEKKKNLGTTPFVIGVGGSISASADLAFGYDTFGLQKWSNSNYDSSKVSQVFDGFYVSDRENADGTGDDVDEFKLTAGLTLSGGVGLALKPAVELFGGLVGELTGGPSFDLKDPNKDGKVRADELFAGNPLAFSGVSIDAAIGAEVSGSLGPLSAKLLSVTFLEGNLFKFDARTQQVELLGLPAKDLINLVNDAVNKIKRAGLELAARGAQLALEATKKAAAIVYNAGTKVVNSIFSEVKTVANVATQSFNKLISVYDAGKAAEQKLKAGKPLSIQEYSSLGAAKAIDVVKAPIVAVKATATKAVAQVTSVISNAGSSVKSSVKSFFSKVFNEDIADALVIFDQNFNGVLDSGEPFTISYDDGSVALTIDLDTFDTNQNGFIDDTEGQRVAIGGYSPYTGLLNDMKFVAPGDSFGINSLTTLVSQMMQDGKNQSEAIRDVNRSLGLPEDLDVGAFIPELALASGDAALAAKFESVQSQVHTAIVQISQVLNGASSKLSADAINQKVIQAIVAQVASGASLNLGNAADIQKLLTDSLTSVQAADPTTKTAAITAIASQLAQVIAESNQRIDAASKAAPQDVLRMIGLTERVALGQVATDLAAVGAGKKSVKALVSEYTGRGFDKQLAAAKKAMTDGTDQSDILRGSRKNDVLRGQKGDDSLFGDSGNDRLFGEADADELSGGVGKDKLDGGVGNDDLNGGNGRDRILGGDGNDMLTGDNGSDLLMGGKGRDRFGLGIGELGSDRIADFSVKDDLLLISGLSGIANFKSGKAIGDKFFHIGQKAADNNDYFIFNKSTGVLSYDANGKGKGQQIKIAQLSPGLAIDASDLVMA